MGEQGSSPTALTSPVRLRIACPQVGQCRWSYTCSVCQQTGDLLCCEVSGPAGLQVARSGQSPALQWNGVFPGAPPCHASPLTSPLHGGSCLAAASRLTYHLSHPPTHLPTCSTQRCAA